MLAQPIPKPVIAGNSRYLFSICGNIKNPAPASTRQEKWTSLGEYFLANHTRANAHKKVTILYQPFTSPVQLTAFSYNAGSSEGVVLKTDWAMLLLLFCQ